MGVLVVANGIIEATAWLIPLLDTAMVVIAADGGARHLLALERTPEIIIGDMDSVGDALSHFEELGSKILRFPADKDETDLELALIYAAQQYPEAQIDVVGAFGGRIDQMLANILLLAHPALAGRRIVLRAPGQQAWVMEGEAEIRGQVGDIVSLISFGESVHIAETRGLKWRLADESLAFGPARGVSNVMTAETATVRLAIGRLLGVHIKKEVESDES